jgi:hypothetical protein
MYGVTGAVMRTELAALLAQHRVQRRLSNTSSEVREKFGDDIRRFRQSVLVWCTQAMQIANPMMFSNLPPRTGNPFLTTEHAGAARELTRALEHAKRSSTGSPATLDLVTTPHSNLVVEHWRQAARAATLAEHDTNASLAGRFTAAQAQALVGDVAAITQALVVLDKRYRAIPRWKPLPNSAQLGWSALAAAIDVNLGHPDYTVDNQGWRPRAKLLRGPVRPGILGVLQAEHNLLIRLHAFPHVANLRLVADSQRHLSGHLATPAARFDEALAARWEHRAATYQLIRQQLRDIGGLLGTGDLAAAEAATIVSRLKDVTPEAIIEPRTLGTFQTLHDKIDQRITDIVEEGLQRGAFTQRVTLPRLETGTGSLITPVRERYRPITSADDLDVVHTIRERLRPSTPAQTASAGNSRAQLHAALAHQPHEQTRTADAPGL